MSDGGRRVRGSTPVVPIRRAGAGAVVRIDAPPVDALPVDALSCPVHRGLLDAVRELGVDTSVEAVVITGTDNRFIAGADPHEMDSPPDEPHLPERVGAVEALEKPVVAAITGAALGGGSEIVLARDLRLAPPRASVGLPETRLGLLPGAGGTQRLPRLIGVARAIEPIGEARVLKAREALDIGLLDRVVEGDVVAASVAVAPAAAKRRLSELAPPRADAHAAEIAAATAIKRAKGAPSVPEAVAIVRAVATEPFEAGLGRERAAFLRLRETPEAQALRHLFLAEREAAKVPGLEEAKPRPVERVAMIGAGTMGTGIAVCLADAGIAVDPLERSADAADAGAGRVRGLYDRQVKGGRLTEAAAERRRGLIRALREAGRLGRKTGRGWYNYGSGKAEPDPEIDDARAKRGVAPRRFTADAIQRRILAVMADEGAKILAEGISLRPLDVDLVFVNGHGFPRPRGGPMFAADRPGLVAVPEDVEATAAAGGRRRRLRTRAPAPRTRADREYVRRMAEATTRRRQAWVTTVRERP